MAHHKHGLFWRSGLLRKKSSLALTLSFACVIVLASCGGGKLQKSLTAGPPPEVSAEGTQQGWQFVPEKFSAEKSQAVVYFHRPMSAFSCQAFNPNKNRTQGKLRVIKKAKNRKEGWRVVRLKGASSWDPTLVVCDESKTPPKYVKGVAIGGKVTQLSRGRTPPSPSSLEKQQGWTFVDTSVSKNYSTRVRTVPNPDYDPKKLGSLPTKTETYEVQTGHTVTAEVYLYQPSTVYCTAQQVFRGSTLKTDTNIIGKPGEMGWYRSRFSFDADESGTYNFPVHCE